MRSIYLATIITVAAIAQPVPASPGLELQIISDSEKFSGCGMGLKFQSAKSNDSRLIYWSDFGEHAIIQIDDKIHKLKQISSAKTKKNRITIITEQWSDNEIQFIIKYHITKSHYESGDLAGTVTVSRGSKSKTYKVIGFRGC